MRDSPHSIRGEVAEEGFSAGLFKRAGQEPEAFCDYGSISWWEKLCRIDLLECSALQLEQIFAGRHRKQLQIISKSINGEGQLWIIPGL